MFSIILSKSQIIYYLLDIIFKYFLPTIFVFLRTYIIYIVMIIYLIKLILILVFNIGINAYYINSGCKCCGNNKSGEMGSGSKCNLGNNPPKGPNSPNVKTPVKG